MLSFHSKQYIDFKHSQTPMVICDESFKILHKNAAANFLSIKRVGSLMIKNISKSDCDRLNENDFDKDPCIILDFINENNNSKSVIVCSYPHIKGSTIWLFPDFYFDTDSTKKQLMGFVPDVVDRIVIEDIADAERNKILKFTDRLIFTKCVRMGMNYCLISNSSNYICVDNVMGIFEKFFNNEMLDTGININILNIPFKKQLFIKNFRAVFCIFANLAIMGSYIGNCGFISVYEEGASLCFKFETDQNSGCDTLISDEDIFACKFPEFQLEILMCLKLCRLLDIDLSLYYSKDHPLFVQFVMKIPVSIPGRLFSNQGIVSPEEFVSDFYNYLLLDEI